MFSVTALWEKSYTENEKGVPLIKMPKGEKKTQIPPSLLFVDLPFILRSSENSEQ